MPYPAWIDVAAEREKAGMRPPLVTIFGAGVAGLSLAHELVERGFGVQVIEATPDPDEEYTCQAGGLAANQLARTAADPPRLHSYLYAEAPNSEECAIATQGQRSVWVWLIAPGNETVAVVVDGETVSIDASTLPTTQEIRDQLRDAIQANTNLSYVTATPLMNGTFPGLEIAATEPGRLLRVRAGQLDPPNTLQPSAMLRYERTHLLGLIRDLPFQQAQPRFAFPERIQFQRDTNPDDWPSWKDARDVPNSVKLDDVFSRLLEAFASYDAPRRALIARVLAKAGEGTPAQALSARMRIREGLLVEIRGHTDCEDTEEASRALAADWAARVRQWLLDRNAAEAGPIPDLEHRLVTIAVGQREPIGNPRTAAGRRRANRVELRIVENILPGEHGYRYFPRFYRHLFDTMKRTPILDREGNATNETAYDQLVPTPTVDLALVRPALLKAPPPPPPEAEDPEEVPARRLRSLEELRDFLRVHLERLGVTARDIVQFQFRLLRFLTASEARRRLWQAGSWWEYLGAERPGRYSLRMIELLRDTPQALVAMDALETDARTQGLIYCQLLIDALTEGVESNRTLNGPTSEAWLRHWKRYLRRQGVRFFTGRLQALEWKNGRLLPVVTFARGFGPEVPVYIVDPGVISGELNSNAFEYSPPEGEETLVNIGKDLAQFLSDRADLAAVADPDEVTTPVVPVRPAAVFGEFVLRARSAGPSVLRVNGTEVVGDGADETAVRDDLRARLEASLVAEGLRVRDLGQQSLILGPGDGVVVSVVGRAPTTYGVSIGGRSIEITSEGRGDEEDIRDQLVAAILRAVPEIAGLDPHDVRPFARTGIRLLGGPHRIDVGPWAGRVVRGLDVHPGEGGLTVFAGGQVQLVLTSEHAAVAKAWPEEEGEDLVVEPLIGGPESGGGSDFYVLAVPYEEASRLVWGAWNTRPTVDFGFNGVFKQLRDFDKATERWVESGGIGVEQPLRRDAGGRPLPPHHPLRDLSGIQFYFENQVRIGRGHTYFVDSPWGLSSISQLAWWRERMSRRSAFLGQLSVDLGTWYRAVERVIEIPIPGVWPVSVAFVPFFLLQPSAWRSSQEEIARETWIEILSGMDRRKAEFQLPPTWYHLDAAIRFEEDGRRAFGRAAVLAEAPGGPAEDWQADVGDVPLGVASGTPSPGPALASQILQQTDHAVAALADGPDGFRLLVAPVASGVRELRVVVVKIGQGVTYRVAVNKAGLGAARQIEVVAGPADGIEAIREDLVNEIHATIPGVVAELEAKQDFEDVPRGILLRSTQPMRVSVLGFDPAAAAGGEDGETYLVSNPTGVVELRPRTRLRLEHPETAAPLRNSTRFLINTPDRVDANGTPIPIWTRRPGIRMASGGGPHEEEEIFYEVELGRWLMVGNHMATHTRLSTMESANESARHAVIAMLHKLIEQGLAQDTYNGQGRLLGEMPEIWKPADYELDDAKPYKRLDERLMAMVDDDGNPLPHFLDILRVGDWVDALPPDMPEVPEDEALQKLIEFAREQLQVDWRFTQIDELAKLLPAVLRGILGGGGS
jgi:hypothetical protein